jgi:hypothetical protein
MTKPQLARALAPFGIRPSGTIRFGRGEGDTGKGYHRDSFEEAWARYLPSDMPSSGQDRGCDPSHRHKPGNAWVSTENRPVTGAGDVTDGKSLEAAENLDCDGVTVPSWQGSGAGGRRWRASWR